MIYGNKHRSPRINMNLLRPVFLTDMCRVCMMTSEYLKEVISYELTPKIIEMLNQLAGIDVSLNDCLPSLICNGCYTKLRDSFNFKNLCIDSNNTLKKYVSKMQNNSSQELSPSKLQISLTNESERIENFKRNKEELKTSLTSTNHLNENSKSEKFIEKKSTNNGIFNNDVECIIIEVPPLKKESKSSNDINYKNTATIKRKLFEKDKIINNNSNDCILIETAKIRKTYKEIENSLNMNNLETIEVESPIKLINVNDDEHININRDIEIEIIDVESFEGTTPIIKVDKDEIKNISESFEYINMKVSATEYSEPSPDYLNALGLVKRTDSTETKNEFLLDYNNQSINSINSNNNSDISNSNCIDFKKIKKEFHCKVCNSTLYDYGTFKRHLANHGELPFHCKICDKRFVGARKLKQHVINAHSGGRPYSCSQCEAKFRTLEEFTAHLRRHAGSTEPHACLQCPRRFASARLLREHSNVHDTERKGIKEKYKRTPNGFGDHICSLCNRRFRKRCDLERHERVHSGEKPYECMICGGRFQQAHNLTKHMVTHTGMRSYTCDICHKTFGRSDVLTRHMHVHEISKPHCCKICSRTFARHSQLVTHMDKRHSDISKDINKLQ